MANDKRVKLRDKYLNKHVNNAHSEFSSQIINFVNRYKLLEAVSVASVLCLEVAKKTLEKLDQVLEEYNKKNGDKNGIN